ncbi:hypothetical protein [Streptomyces sp. NPDC008139]|uniref:fascin domain-containing protein n=1 Tax=Streptomyces sp. NPDC008139 TaxID=3364814 RepID=UPI0036F08684
MIRPPALVTTALLAAGLLTAGLLVPAAAPPAAAATATTAWQNGGFHVDTPNVIRRSNIVLGSPNTAAAQSLPLGNGSLGAAAWAAGGFTAQLNRADTLPGRKSPGQVQIPGLSALTNASDFKGSLDVYTSVLTESGGGMILKSWVSATKDELIVDVTGADPGAQQTVTLSLWSGRGPQAAVSGTVGTLAETWVDNQEAGSSGRTFGSLAALSAGGRNVTASVVNSTQVKVTFTPNADGSYRVILGAPTWTGGNAATTAANLLGSDATAAESSLLSSQKSWWSGFWANSGVLEATSADGTAQYMETLRTLYLYMEAASMRGTVPGSQAGVGGDPGSGANAACSQPGSPNWNALNITSGAEISLFIWQQYLATGDINFLRTYYPLLKSSATFLLNYQKVGSDGKLHAVANAHANGQYVTADNAGAAPLIAKVDAVGTWEQFQLVRNGDGSVSLRARVNNQYVTAENGGAAALIANRAAIGQWEEFDLIQS